MVKTIKLYQQNVTHSAFYPGRGTPLGLAYVVLKLNGKAGELAEHVGKAMCDDGLIAVDMIETDTDHGLIDTGSHNVAFADFTPERRAAIIKEIGDVLWYLSAACNELGISLSEAAATNLEKIFDRSERDALRGSGDNR